MTEKQQHTALSMREKMLNRYGDGLHHKHNKNHNLYRKHCKTYPIQILNDEVELLPVNSSTGAVRELKLRKIRKRMDNGRFH